MGGVRHAHSAFCGEQRPRPSFAGGAPMIADDHDACPVPAEMIGRLYRSPQHGVSELVSGLSSARRGSLAAFCYGRAHLRDIGLAIAATCDLETLVEAGGRAGMFLFEQSRVLPQEDKPRNGSKQAK